MSNDAMSAPIVQMRGITITFPGVLALDQVDFTLYPGEVHSLMGENGAGKSTLIKALTGVYGIDAGTISVGGNRRRFTSAGDAQDAGISTVYQEVNLCTNLSVGENVMLGHEPRRHGRIDWTATHDQASTFLKQLGLSINTRSLLSRHPIAIQQLVAISRAIVLDAKVVVLDEPTSSLDRDEVEQLFAVVRRLRDRGVAVLFVSHFLDQVYEISDRITVLRDGSLVGEYLVADLPKDKLVAAMLGREMEELDSLSARTDRSIDRSGTPIVRAADLGRSGAVNPADLSIYPSEVVGLAGLLGSGRTELMRLLYGADRSDSGTVEVKGAQTRIHQPRHAISHNIAFSSENRRDEGIIADLSVADNIVFGVQAQRGWRRIRSEERNTLVKEYMTALGVRPADPTMQAGLLSGGNQQKVLLGRWLATNPEVLILDEPTRGIDVGAKADIQRKVAELSETGLAVFFISSELDEVLRIAQRVAVMRDRHKIGELESHDTDVDSLIAYIAHEGEVNAS